MKALTPARLTGPAGLPAYCATPSDRSVSNHVDRFDIACHHASVSNDFQTSPRMSRLVAAPRRIEFVFYGPTFRLQLLSTLPRASAVTFDFGVVAYSVHGLSPC